MIKETIIEFHKKHFSGFNLEIIEQDNDLINLYVQKNGEYYTLAANTKTLQKLNLNQKELEALLYHEKGHIYLQHLKKNETSLDILFFLLQFMVVICISISLLNIYFNLSVLLTISSIITIVLGNSFFTELRKMRNKELEADKYAIKFCNKEDFKSMLQKLEDFYQLKNKKFYYYYFSTHPSIKIRLEQL